MAARELVAAPQQGRYKFASSAGIGAWNAAPWLAVLHPDVTTTAQAGYYPVYLFEPGFKTVCLVMGQGAKKLEEAVGSKRALVEFAVRAETLRQASTAWKAKGFSIGPFQTTRDNASKHGSSSAAKADPWATSVAFGKRYQISALPEDDVLRNDLNQMLGIYNDLVKKKTLSVVTLDEMLQHMAATGEMPDAEAGIDGAKRVILPRHSRTQPDAQLASVSRA